MVNRVRAALAAINRHHHRQTAALPTYNAPNKQQIVSQQYNNKHNAWQMVLHWRWPTDNRVTISNNVGLIYPCKQGRGSVVMTTKSMMMMRFLRTVMCEIRYLNYLLSFKLYGCVLNRIKCTEVLKAKFTFFSKLL